jgi:uncharacterized membrane protein YoaK (UPF0700 family)
VTPRPALIPTILVLVGSNFTASIWTAAALAFGMGAQNAATTQIAGITLNTVFVTGDLQKLMEDIVKRLLPKAAREIPAAREPAALSLVWIGYVAGALLGAAADRWLMLPFLVPAGLLLLFVLCANIPKSVPS